MQKKNNKGVIALIIVFVLAAAALVICQINKPETQQGGKEITINVDHLNGDDTTANQILRTQNQDYYTYADIQAAVKAYRQRSGKQGRFY